jgi:hypothetical protein
MHLITNDDQPLRRFWRQVAWEIPGRTADDCCEMYVKITLKSQAHSLSPRHLLIRKLVDPPVT